MNIVKSLNSVSCIHRNRPPQCDHCPTKYNLTSWREKEDVEFSVTSDQNSALVKYDFEKLYKAGRYPGWMEDVNVELHLKREGAVLDKTAIRDAKNTKNLTVEITMADELCLELRRGSDRKSFCKVTELPISSNDLTYG